MDFIKFCEDFRIKTASFGHKHQRAGWINISCPFCSGDPGFHLGWNNKQQYFSCYRCGWNPIEKVISALSGRKDIKSLLVKYKGKIPLEEKTTIVRPEEVKLPDGTSLMTSRHKQYLSKRLSNPDYLETFWGLKGTGHTGSYRFRIIAPIYFQGQLVSYQGRDITDKQQAKYKAASEEEEIISHKHILYGWDKIPAEVKSCLVVEGVTGVWRFGVGALGIFGVEYTASQVRLLAERFEKIYLLLDADEAGERATNKLLNDLSVMGREVIALGFTEKGKRLDSGSIPQNIADKMIEKIRQGIF